MLVAPEWMVGKVPSGVGRIGVFLKKPLVAFGIDDAAIRIDGFLGVRMEGEDRDGGEDEAVWFHGGSSCYRRMKRPRRSWNFRELHGLL